jgi:hypothetical protein
MCVNTYINEAKKEKKTTVEIDLKIQKDDKDMGR